MNITRSGICTGCLRDGLALRWRAFCRTLETGKQWAAGWWCEPCGDAESKQTNVRELVPAATEAK